MSGLVETFKEFTRSIVKILAEKLAEKGLVISPLGVSILVLIFGSALLYVFFKNWKLFALLIIIAIILGLLKL